MALQHAKRCKNERPQGRIIRNDVRSHSPDWLTRHRADFSCTVLQGCRTRWDVESWSGLHSWPPLMVLLGRSHHGRFAQVSTLMKEISSITWQGGEDLAHRFISIRVSWSWRYSSDLLVCSKFKGFLKFHLPGVCKQTGADPGDATQSCGSWHLPFSLSTFFCGCRFCHFLWNKLEILILSSEGL